MRSQKSEVVIDTNVAVVANGKAEQASEKCVVKCIAVLIRTRCESLVLLDSKSHILNEYRRNLHPSGQPGPGDSFFKWLFENQANPKYCRTIQIRPDPDRGFVEFPADVRLTSFDQDDRKFVAVALASGSSPKILNAADTDWWLHRIVLQEHGVEAEFICPELMNA